MPQGDANFHELIFPEGVIPDPPERFTFPFHYVPHPLAVAAARDLQRHLRSQTDWFHDFGFEGEVVGARGKMFGVMVVRDARGRLGYLAAYSGKLADSNHLPGFVPPVYDTLLSQGFYKLGEQRLVKINAAVKQLEASTELARAQEAVAEARKQAEQELDKVRTVRREAKAARKQRRQAAREVLDTVAYAALEQELARESVARHFAVKDLTRRWQERILELEEQLKAITDRIERLKNMRKEYSHYLQNRIFRNYRFLDARGEEKDLPAIFADTVFKIPPAGAGECAAPKLLQYAYLREYQPVCMAEFWWGQSPKSAIRRHGEYYFACRGKCEPILGHMLQGLTVDPNPLHVNPARGKELSIVYEDDALVVVNKPHEFLSVPGKIISDCVYSRIREQYPEATGPLIVHRLDMSTSGLLLLTKTSEANRLLQKQFLDRTIKKRYVAILAGAVAEDEGMIELPLRGDFEDRPRQIVCHEHGKPAKTLWKVVERLAGQTRVHLWPVTGRTHQLRVHCAHPLGLNAPILGDDLYGPLADRLHLHAEEITFNHPLRGDEMTLTAPAAF